MDRTSFVASKPTFIYNIMTSSQSEQSQSATKYPDQYSWFVAFTLLSGMFTFALSFIALRLNFIETSYLSFGYTCLCICNLVILYFTQNIRFSRLFQLLSALAIPVLNAFWPDSAISLVMVTLWSLVTIIGSVSSSSFRKYLPGWLTVIFVSLVAVLSIELLAGESSVALSEQASTLVLVTNACYSLAVVMLILFFHGRRLRLTNEELAQSIQRNQVLLHVLNRVSQQLHEVNGRLEKSSESLRENNGRINELTNRAEF
jgi:hypothetical protein